MTADLTREQAREQVARELYVVAHAGVLAGPASDDILRRTWAKNAHRDSITGPHRAAADAALTVLWPVVEKYQRGARTLGEILDRTLLDIVSATDSQDLINEDGDGDWAIVHERLAAMGAMVRRAEGLEVEVERLRAELAHAHTVIARHVEPRREGEP